MTDFICGCDEVGTGAGAGPFFVSAVLAQNNWSIPGLNDSKKMTDKQRRIMSDKLWSCVEKKEISIAISNRTNTYIDEHGFVASLQQCYKDVINQLYSDNCIVIIDGDLDFSKALTDINYKTIIKADAKIYTVMAASIIAKVARDNVLIELSSIYPEYDFANNKGYLSPKHINAIKKFGLSNIHRKSYKINF